MAGNLNTSVVAQFSEGSTQGQEAGIAIKEDADLSSTVGITYLKVYPKMPDLFFVTAGSYSVKSSKEEEAQTALAFDLDTESAMPIYGALDVEITPQGNAYDARGNVIGVTFRFDPVTGNIKASKECYAVVLVNYTAPYTLVEYQFAGEGCPINPVYTDSDLYEYDGYYIAAMVVAADTVRDQKASIQLKPPQCGADLDMSVSIEVNKRILPKLVLEPHDGVGVQLEGTTSKLAAGGLVRLYPAGTLAEVDATAGRVDRKYRDGQLDIQEYVVFNGDYSRSLKYPPINKAGSLSETIQVTNAVGNPITVQLATGGDSIIMASFDNDGGYQIIGRRTLENDEVVPINSAGIAIPVWGTAKVAYTTSYEILRYAPVASKDARIFESAMITAKQGTRSATYKVDPPAVGGTLSSRGTLTR